MIELRPYQSTCVERVVAAFQQQPCGGKALVVLPTGGGKTIVFTEIARRLGLNTLIIAHRQELLQQAADKFRLVDPLAVIGQVGAGRHEYGYPITVASVQTISRPEHLRILQRFHYGLVIIDECFPAGTLIDGKPVEQIRAGDLVTAFNEQTHTFAFKRVLQTSRRPAGPRLLKIVAGQTSIVCTPNHPFYTASGWKAAELLSPTEELLYVRDPSALHLLSTALPTAQEVAKGPFQSWQEPVLFGGLQEENRLEAVLRNDGEDQSKIRFSSYEEQQPHAPRGQQEEGPGDPARTRTCSQDTRGQWDRPDRSTKDAGRGVGMADGICRVDPSAQEQRTPCPHSLQSGHRQSGFEDSHRGRWHESCSSESAGTGPQERTGACWVRVDRVEVYQPGSDGTFAGLCSDGHVYNFEVEDDHTYLANGFVVHNCHHSAASGYQAVLDALPEAFVLGVTATPDRMDGASIEAIFGEPLFTASIVDMVEQGHLCDLRALAVRTSTSLDGLHTHNGDFKAEELEELIDTPDRNGRVVKAYQEHCAGRQALCFAVTVAHAAHLAESFNAMGVRAAFVSGGTAPEERKRLLLAYERGELTVLCNVGVLTEGYDAPQTSCVILARPTKSRALFVQCIGRGTRTAPGKQDCVILDITDNCLKHRLQPLTLGTVLEKDLRDGESITEARVRRAREAEESAQRERTLKVMQRSQDLAINLLARMDWKRSAGGTYTLEVGDKKHRILLVPSETHAGHYSVWAHLAPDFQGQQWLKEVPLDWAQQHAEIKARLLQSNEKKLVLVDSNAAWRAWPVSDKQVFLLRKFDIPFTDALTRGEASDLIGRAMAERDRLKAEKKATKGTRTKKAKVSA